MEQNAQQSPAGKVPFSLQQAVYPEMKPNPCLAESDYLPWDAERRGKFEQADQEWRDSISALSSGMDYSGKLDHFLFEANREFLTGPEAGNTVWSPLNVWLSLAVLAEITGGESRAQLMRLLGSASLEDLRATAHALWRDHYRDDGLISSILANSLWLSEKLPCQGDTLQTLAEQFYVSSFAGSMGTAAYTEALQNWVDQQTHGLLREYTHTLSLEPGTLLALVSALYFKAEWMYPFEEELTQEGLFHASSGDVPADFMHKHFQLADYCWNDQFSATSLLFTDFAFHMWFLLPNEGIRLEDLISSGTAMEFLLADKPSHSDKVTGCRGTAWNLQSVEVDISLPKFDTFSGMDLVSVLTRLGVSDIFSPGTADFSSLTKAPGTYISQMEQAVRIIVSERRVEAAANWSAFALAAILDHVTFTLDRPFLFAVEGDANLPLLLGVVQQP